MRASPILSASLGVFPRLSASLRVSRRLSASLGVFPRLSGDLSASLFGFPRRSGGLSASPWGFPRLRAAYSALVGVLGLDLVRGCMFDGFGLPFGSLLVPLWLHFGSILVPFWGLWGSLGPCRDVVGKLSGSWVVFGSLWGPFLASFWHHLLLIFWIVFFSSFGLVSGSILAHFWLPKWYKNDSRSGPGRSQILLLFTAFLKVFRPTGHQQCIKKLIIF